MSTVTGVIEAKTKGKSRFGTYGIKMDDGNWYNSKFEIPAEKGDRVTFEADGKRNIRDLKVLSGGEDAPSSPAVSGPAHAHVSDSERQRLIVRQSSLGHAVSLVSALLEQDGFQEGVDYIERALSCAEAFEKWVFRNDTQDSGDDVPFEE